MFSNGVLVAELPVNRKINQCYPQNGINNIMLNYD